MVRWCCVRDHGRTSFGMRDERRQPAQEIKLLFFVPQLRRKSQSLVGAAGVRVARATCDTVRGAIQHMN